MVHAGHALNHYVYTSLIVACHKVNCTLLFTW
jgi:hypothetical protein